MDKRKKFQEVVDDLLADSNLKNEFIKTRIFLKKYFDQIGEKFDKFDQVIKILKALKFPDTVKISNLSDIPRPLIRIPNEVTINNSNWLKLDEFKTVIQPLIDKLSKEEVVEVKDDEPTYTTAVDESNPGVTYVGEAPPKSKATSSVWRIQRVRVIRGISYIEYADGNDKFDNNWDKRTSLAYS